LNKTIEIGTNIVESSLKRYASNSKMNKTIDLQSTKEALNKDLDPLFYKDEISQRYSLLLTYLVEKGFISLPKSISVRVLTKDYLKKDKI